MHQWRELVQKAQQGNLDAFDALVERFRDMAIGYAYSLLHDFPLAQDAAQEAFVQAYRDLGSLRCVDAFPAWFRRIVFKHCDRLTRRRCLPTIPLEAAHRLEDDARTPLEELETREESDAGHGKSVAEVVAKERHVYPDCRWCECSNRMEPIVAKGGG